MRTQCIDDLRGLVSGLAEAERRESTYCSDDFARFAIRVALRGTGQLTTDELLIELADLFACSADDWPWSSAAGLGLAPVMPTREHLKQWGKHACDFYRDGVWHEPNRSGASAIG